MLVNPAHWPMRHNLALVYSQISPRARTGKRGEEGLASETTRCIRTENRQKLRWFEKLKGGYVFGQIERVIPRASALYTAVSKCIGTK